MEVKDIINEGRPVEPYCFETDNEVTWYKIGANDGYAYALEEFENNRLKACESQTEAESERELNFAIKFFEEHHRQPTFSDAIEETRKQMIDKACKWLENEADNFISDFMDLHMSETFYEAFRKAMEE